MKIFSYIFLIFINISCEKTKLLPITAEKLKEVVHDFKGEKAVLVNVWALWCIPCIEEFPMIVKLSKEIKDLEVVFISADFKDQMENGVTTLIEAMINQELGEPFRRDAMTAPVAVAGINAKDMRPQQV